MNGISAAHPSIRSDAIHWLRNAMEGVVLLMVTLSPWFFASVDPVFEYALFACVALLAILWGVRSVLEKQFLWFACPVALCLGLIFVFGVIQLVPMPNWALTVASPAAANWNRELLPGTLEVISPGEPPAAVPGWPSISVYPNATRYFLFRLLALFLLFACVRVNIASTGSLKRLAWIAVCNGVALSLFGIYQFVAAHSTPSQPNRTVFGFPVRGDVFGPFICRNHFAFFANICAGLGVGLLLITGRTEGEKRAQRTHKAAALVEQTADEEATLSILSILHSPLQLYLSVAIAIIVGGVVCSMSRGGVAALVCGAIAAVLLRGFAGKRIARLELVAVPILLVIGLVAWLGIKPLESRLNISSSDITTDGRLTIWKNLLPLALRFPVFGTGYGTLEYVEPLSRSRDYMGYNAIVTVDHAHNEYLEALVEGGLPRFLLTVGVVVLLLRYGRKAIRRHENRSAGRLAFGALIGIAAVSAHSFVDFGMFTPAVAVFATVVAAQLCAMARSDPSRPPTDQSKHAIVLNWSGLGGILAAAGLTLLGYLLVRHGDLMVRVQQHRVTAFRELHKIKTPNPDQAMASLAAAINESPDDANLRAELGQVGLDAWQRATRKADGSRIESSSNTELIDRFVKPALKQIIIARNLCPFLPRPQARLAAYAFDSKSDAGFRLAQSDPAEKYWARAVLLAPYDADLLYYAGLIKFQAQQYDAAWKDWRASLTQKPSHLKAIVTAALPVIGGEGLAQRLIPDDPIQLLETARLLAVRPDMVDVQRQLLHKAKNVLTATAVEHSRDPNTPYLMAHCHRMLGESKLARSAFETAIGLSPKRFEWRYEFAEFLYSLQNDRDKREALEILKQVLLEQPGFGPAYNLEAVIRRDLAPPE